MRGRFSFGFTVVELIVVVVIIGILAGIVPVAYRGIQNRANDSAVQSDLSKISDIINAGYINSRSYPGVGSGLGSVMSEASFKKSTGSYLDSSSLVYCQDVSTNQTMAIIGRSKSGNVFYIRNDDAVKQQSTQTFNCADQLPSVPAGNVGTASLWNYT